jgi:hypothetical protein
VDAEVCETVEGDEMGVGKLRATYEDPDRKLGLGKETASSLFATDEEADTCGGGS